MPTSVPNGLRSWCLRAGSDTSADLPSGKAIRETGLALPSPPRRHHRGWGRVEGWRELPSGERSRRATRSKSWYNHRVLQKPKIILLALATLLAAILAAAGGYSGDAPTGARSAGKYVSSGLQELVGHHGLLPTTVLSDADDPEYEEEDEEDKRGGFSSTPVALAPSPPCGPEWIVRDTRHTEGSWVHRSPRGPPVDLRGGC